MKMSKHCTALLESGKKIVTTIPDYAKHLREKAVETNRDIEITNLSGGLHANQNQTGSSL